MCGIARVVAAVWSPLTMRLDDQILLCLALTQACLLGSAYLLGWIHASKRAEREQAKTREYVTETAECASLVKLPRG